MSSADKPTPAFGEALRQQVEERLNFFATGEPPAKNADAIRKVLDALALDDDDDEDDEETPALPLLEASPTKDKKQKRKADDSEDEEEEAPRKKVKLSKEEKKALKKEEKKKKRKHEYEEANGDITMKSEVSSCLANSSSKC